MTSPAITEFANLIAQAKASCEVNPPDHIAIQNAIQAIATHFQTQMLPLTDTLNPAVLVEINKQLRLLKTDGLFLRSAQNLTAEHPRLAQIQQRLELLSRYDEMLNGTE